MIYFLSIRSLFTSWPEDSYDQTFLKIWTFTNENVNLSCKYVCRADEQQVYSKTRPQLDLDWMLKTQQWVYEGFCSRQHRLRGHLYLFLALLHLHLTADCVEIDRKQGVWHSECKSHHGITTKVPFKLPKTINQFEGKEIICFAFSSTKKDI